MPDEKIPVDKQAKVRCPKCSAPIVLTRPQAPDETGGQIHSTPPLQTPQPEIPAAGPQHYKPEFSGSGEEYFKIWIVNTFLTIITFGIYAAWAKVRTRRYFYANTKIGGHSFDYLAEPTAILKGNLLIGGGFILYTSLQHINPLMSFGVAILFAVVFPLLIYKSLRFQAHNSSYRNIRFRFLGNLGESYKTYLFLPMAIPFTLGLILPYWEYRRKHYFFDNFAFGKSTNTFSGEPGPFYKVYGLAYLMMIALFGCITFVGIGVGTMSILQTTASSAEPKDLGLPFFVAIIAGYLAMLLFFTLVQQFIYARLTNYCWNVSSLGALHFKSTMQARRLFWIRLTNILAIIFTLGFYTPWAKIRRTRYILDNIELTTEQGLNHFAAATEMEETAYGEAATDFFDFEIGL